MQYLSTRGQMPPAAFSDVLLEGLAPDGGLVVPERYPAVDDDTLTHWRSLDYAALAREVLRLYCDDLDPAVLSRLTQSTYCADVFGSEQITPLQALDGGLSLLRLSNGPTLAFKDMAMQLLGALFEYVLAQRGATLNVLGATSGDTGSAAEYALRGRKGIQVFMLSPHGRMSAFQRAQMYSLQDANIFNLAIEGVFDDCQDIVKRIAGDVALKRAYRLGAVNSINWARVVAQVVYYFKGYFAATEHNAQRVSFAVPSGNFGNIHAGWIAKQMGLPIERLVLATNENNVLDEFFRTGRYRVRPPEQTHATSSPSMDISKASNFERFIFDVCGRDAQLVRELWWEVDTRGEFDLTGSPVWDHVRASGLVSACSTHADRLATIRDIYEKTGVVVDPHTADGIKAARQYVQDGVPMICLETALPIKFSETIVEAIGQLPARPQRLEGLEDLPQRFTVLPADVEQVKAFVAAHVR